jgi:hypothetical protein
VPTFFSHSTFDLDGLRQHFKFAALRSSEQQVVFLNQVAGFWPFGQASLFSAVNVVDGRFQCNLEGPDVWTFPPEAKSIAQSILPAFRPDFLTSASSHFDFSDAGRKECDWGPFRPPSVPPLLPVDRKSEKHRHMKSPPWTSPPKVFVFSGGALCYNLVYVEDTSRRLPPQASDRGLVAMPILVATPEEVFWWPCLLVLSFHRTVQVSNPSFWSVSVCPFPAVRNLRAMKKPILGV